MPVLSTKVNNTGLGDHWHCRAPEQVRLWLRYAKTKYTRVMFSQSRPTTAGYCAYIQKTAPCTMYYGCALEASSCGLKPSRHKASTLCLVIHKQQQDARFAIQSLLFAIFSQPCLGIRIRCCAHQQSMCQLCDC